MIASFPANTTAMTPAVGIVTVDNQPYLFRGTNTTINGRVYHVLEHPVTGWRGMWLPDQQRWSSPPR
jgi:hypothetical protein